MNISARTATVTLAVIAASAVVMAVVPAQSAIIWAARLFLSSAFVMFIPGALALLAWDPRRSFDALEFTGKAVAMSFGLDQLLTIAALLVHWSPLVSLIALGTLVLICAFRSVSRRDVVIHAGIHHAVIVAGLVLLACYLWAAGSPFDSLEDHIHVAIIERLAHLTRPSIHNIYYAPGIVYTYPFPGTHYVVALIGRLGDIPSLFLYSKMRAVWGMLAPLLLYGCVVVLFDSVAAAIAATLTAICLVANGSFAAVPDMYWGQMAPFSHASDVAMGVLLPALLLLTFEALASVDRREYWFSVAAALPMALMLAIAHTREIVQFVVYVTSFAVALLLARGSRRLLQRTVVILCATVAVVVVYRLWNVWAVPIVDSLVAANRQHLRSLFRAATWPELFGRPLPLLDNYMPAFQPMFYGWNPVVLLASPFILFAVRGRKLTWLLAASIACYALIIRYPAFGIPYTYLTYFEILYTPVRNVIFFVHVLAGIGLFVLASMFSRFRYGVLVPLAAATGLLIALAVRRVGTAATQNIDLLFVPMLIGYALLLVALMWTGRRETRTEQLFNPRPRWAIAFTIMAAIVVYATYTKDAAVLVKRWDDRMPIPAAVTAGIQCGEKPAFCAPPDALIRFAHERLPADAVFASDLQDPFQPALFMPQQMVIWPGGDSFSSLLSSDQLFPQYVRYLTLAKAASREQPLFNTSETRQERDAFLRDVGATHVLLNFRLYAEMKPIFDAEKDLMASRYDDGKWAVYEVLAR